MATGVQAAQMMIAKAAAKEPTSDNMCVHGLRTEIFGPLGVVVPPSDTISTFLIPPITEVSAPFVGCIGRFPRSEGYEHICLITGISGDTLTETSFGTAVGYVRSANYPTSFFESFWDPHYNGKLSPVVSTAADVQQSGGGNVFTDIAGFGAIINQLSSPGFWVRVGLFGLGAALVLIALIKIVSATDAGKAAIKAGKTAAKTAVKAGEVAAL